MHYRRTLSSLAVLALLGVAMPASAEKSYTPAQLRSMVSSGKYPKQASPTTKSESMDYVTCISKVESIISSIKPNYPSQTIASTNVMRVEKVWTNDAAMTLTCSAPDRKIIITSAAYE